MHTSKRLAILTAVLALSLSPDADGRSPRQAEDPGWATPGASIPLGQEPSWYQISPQLKGIQVDGSENAVRLTFTNPDFYDGHFLFVQSYYVVVAERLLIPGGINMFEEGEEVFYELDRGFLEQFDAVAFKLFSGDPMDPRNNPGELATPTTVNAVIHNSSSSWAPPVVIPVLTKSASATGSLPGAPAGAISTRTTPKAGSNQPVSIPGVAEGGFVLYCCPALMKEDGKKATGPFSKPKGKPYGCTVNLNGLDGKPLEPVLVLPGLCIQVSGLATTSSSGTYWKSPSK